MGLLRSLSLRNGSANFSDSRFSILGLIRFKYHGTSLVLSYAMLSLLCCDYCHFLWKEKKVQDIELHRCIYLLYMFMSIMETPILDIPDIHEHVHTYKDIFIDIVNGHLDKRIGLPW